MRKFLCAVMIVCVFSAGCVGNFYKLSLSHIEMLETQTKALTESVITHHEDSGKGGSIGNVPLDAAPEEPVSSAASGSSEASDAKKPAPAKTVKAAVDPMRRKINFSELKAINSDVVSWIYMPNSPVDYYVMRERTPNEFFYLWRDIYCQKSEFGSIFEPAYETGSFDEDAKRLVFGHNMAYGGVAFSENMKYHDKAYADANPYVYFYYEDRVERWELWSGGVYDPYDDVYLLNFERGSDDYEQLLQHMTEKSEWVRFATPDKNTKITVLSTCDDTHGYRFALSYVWSDSYYYDGVPVRYPEQSYSGNIMSSSQETGTYRGA